MREKYNEKDTEYEQKYDFINKALLESVARITEMTKPDHSAATARVKWSCYHHCLMVLSQR